MFSKLKQRWGVNAVSLFLIICTFAVGGSLCGWVAKRIMNFLELEKGIAWVVLYIIIMTITWPLCVLLISIPFRQFRFFKKYLQKIAQKMTKTRKEQEVINIAIFASGAGSNAKKIIEYFTSPPAPLLEERGVAKIKAKIALIVSNKPGAGVLKIAADNNIETLLIEKEPFFRGDAYVQELKKRKIDFIVLAGFLWKIPSALIAAYPNKIVNIHPALLPGYGGKGMYGHFVHEAVIKAGEKESGITIHYVDELYDHGNIIFQAKCIIDEADTPDTLAQKIHVLEHAHYPLIINKCLQNAKSQLKA